MIAYGEPAGRDAVDHDGIAEATGGTPRLDDIRGMPILVLDEAGGAATLVDMLTASGFRQVCAAHDWDDALARLHDADRRADGVDLILLNTGVAAFGGYRLCRLMRGHRTWRDTPVIALLPRADWRDGLLAEGLDAGATDVVFMPVASAQDLVPRVVSALLLRRERDIRRRREGELEAELAERMVMEARLQYLVSHDDLTGLANRRRFEQVTEAAIARLRDARQDGAIIYIDLDQFKIINDTCGHIAGDELLRQVAALLQGRMRSRDTLARLGGDEFGILMEYCSVSSAVNVAAKIQKNLRNFLFHWRSRQFRIGISIGILQIRSGRSVTETLSRADSACYVAKKASGNGIHIYTPGDAAPMV